jgi:hypothetical protein
MMHGSYVVRGLTPKEIGLDFRKLIEQKDKIVHSYPEKKPKV